MFRKSLSVAGLIVLLAHVMSLTTRFRLTPPEEEKRGARRE